MRIFIKGALILPTCFALGRELTALAVRHSQVACGRTQVRVLLRTCLGAAAHSLLDSARSLCRACLTL